MKSFWVSCVVLFFLVSSSPNAWADYVQDRQTLLQKKRDLLLEMAEKNGDKAALTGLKYRLGNIDKYLKNLARDNNFYGMGKQSKSSSVISNRQREIANNRSEQVVLGKRKLKPVVINIKSSNEKVAQNYSSYETGKASYYAGKFNGRHTASGEVFSNNEFTAAHRTLPFGTKVRVVNIANGNNVEVTINDRGPYSGGRILDLSAAAFSSLDNLSRGIIEVELQVLE